MDSGDLTAQGLVLSGQEGTWEENIEAVSALKWKDRFLLCYSGCQETGGVPMKGFPADLGLAVSTDGIR